MAEDASGREMVEELYNKILEENGIPAERIERYLRIVREARAEELERMYGEGEGA